MNKREFLRLAANERRNVVREAARDVDAVLNLSGRETIDELMTAALDGTAENLIDNLLTPSLPDFPASFCRAARPVCNRFLRYVRYWGE